LFCCTGGQHLLPAVSTLRRSLALSAKNAASLSNVDRNLAATAAVSDLSQSTTAAGILSTII